MNNMNSSELFKQVRMSHRIAVAYYKRLFQMLRDVTNDERLGLSFYTWEPSEYGRPCQLQTNVFERWEWNLLPGLSTNYLFFTAKDRNAQAPGEWLIDFHVISDTGVLRENRKDNQDPLELSISVDNAKSVIRCSLMAVSESMSLNWYNDVWKESDYPTFTEKPEIEYIDDDEKIYGCGFELSLEDLTGQDASEILVNKIIEFRDALLSS